MLDKTSTKSWQELFEALPDDMKDVHWLPQYVEAHHLGDDKNYGVMVEPNYGVWQTFSGDGSPYGYGGPYPWDYMEHYRLHPLFPEPMMMPSKEKEIVAIDLTEPERYNRSITNGLRSAELAGVRVDRDEHFGPTSFSIMYARTMRRKGAKPDWSLDVNYFRRFHKLLMPHFKLFRGYVNDQVEAEAIVLYGWGKAYYHYAASYRRYPEAAVGTAIIHEIAVWAREQGMQWLHLGGGPTNEPDDSVLKFKKGFTNGKTIPVYCYRGG